MPKAHPGYFYVSPDGQMIELNNLADALKAARRPQGFVWLDYCQPTREELEQLIEPLGLHPLAVEDATDENQIPKVEDYPKNTFILFNAFEYVGTELKVYEVDFFIGANYLVTVSNCAEGQRFTHSVTQKIVEREISITRQGPAYLAHELLDWIVDQKFAAIEAIEDRLDAAEDAILSDHAHFNPGDLIQLRRDLLALRKSLFHEREILVKICRYDSKFIPEQAIVFYRDIYDHLAKFFELTESSRDIISSLMEMYLSMINNQMTRAANQTNVTVRRLTFITTIFMPLSLLAGIGGMSEWSMMTGPENWRISYPLFLVAMAVIGVANYYLLKWIDRHSKEDD